MFTGVYMGKCIIRTSKDIHCLSHSENTIQAILVCVFISCTQKTQGLLGSTWNIFPLDPMHDWCSICANCPILCKLQDVNKSILQIKGRRTWFYAALWSTIHIHTLWWLLQYMHILIFWFHRVATSLLCVEGAASFSIRIFHSSLLSSFFFFLSRRRLFWEVIPQKLLRNNFTWHVPIQGSTKGSRNIIHWRQSRGSRGTKSPCVCVSYNEEEEKDPNHLRGSNTARMRQKDGRDAEKLKYQCARNRRPSL